jgi:hypothetical protein
MPDAVKNFGVVNTSTGYDNTDTSIVLESGHGANLPDPAVDQYNLVWWNSTDYATPALDPDVEIVRVTAKSTDTLTVTRAQESTNASNKNIAGKTYTMFLGATAKVFTDIYTSVAAKQPSDATLDALAAYNTNGLLTQTTGDTFTGRTITGTASRISITNGNGVSGNPTINIDTSYAGQNTITTLGTIGTGTWNATAIGETKGGTGQTSITQGDLLYGSAANTISKLAKNASATRYLANTGTSNSPAWNQVNLTNGVTGILPAANGGIGDGWVPAGETWTYASATTFTIAGVDVTAKYPVGTKIKLTQTTEKLFYVVGSSFSTNTTITVTGGDDYTLANAAITSPYYSYMETPQGFPQVFNYTPTYSASGSMTFESITTTYAKIRVTGRFCELWISATGTTGGTANTTLIATLLIAQAGSDNHIGAGVTVDTGSPTLLGALVTTSGTTLVAIRKYDGSNYGLGTGRSMRLFVKYPIA